MNQFQKDFSLVVSDPETQSKHDIVQNFMSQK